MQSVRAIIKQEIPDLDNLTPSLDWWPGYGSVPAPKALYIKISFQAGHNDKRYLLPQAQ